MMHTHTCAGGCGATSERIYAPTFARWTCDECSRRIWGHCRALTPREVRDRYDPAHWATRGPMDDAEGSLSDFPGRGLHGTD